MLKRAFLTTTLILIATSTPLYAQDMFEGLSPQERHEKLKAMAPEQREAFFKERKAKWQAMNDAEKLEIIEKQRSERIKAMDEQWSKMSDAEKIRHVEEKMKHKHGKHEKFRDGEDKYGQKDSEHFKSRGEKSAKTE